jgi:hypothetical protein
VTHFIRAPTRVLVNTFEKYGIKVVPPRSLLPP